LTRPAVRSCASTTFPGVIDLHAHPLPALDDGAATQEAARALLAAAAAAGVTTIAATPHVSERYPTTADTMVDAVARLGSSTGDLPIEVVTGGEVALSFVGGLSDEELLKFTLGSSGRYLLVELPPPGWSLGTELALARLRTLGIRPLIAHPERHPLIQERPERLSSLLENGAVFQVTARHLSRRVKRSRTAATARELVRRGLIHCVASDAHGVDPDSPSPWGVELSDRLADRLLVDNPTAILRGDPLDPLPRRRPLLERAQWRRGDRAR
jgi:protein-tyrosine phosphatase